MKAAFAVWEGRISPVFDVSRRALLVTFEDGQERERREASIDGPSAADKVTRLRDLDVDVVVCGAISAALQQALVGHGVQVVPFVAGDIEAVASAFGAGTLPAPRFTMPGCTGQRRRCRGGAARWRGAGSGRGGGPGGGNGLHGRNCGRGPAPRGPNP